MVGSGLGVEAGRGRGRQRCSPTTTPGNLRGVQPALQFFLSGCSFHRYIQVWASTHLHSCTLVNVGAPTVCKVLCVVLLEIPGHGRKLGASRSSGPGAVCRVWSQHLRHSSLCLPGESRAEGDSDAQRKSRKASQRKRHLS